MATDGPSAAASPAGQPAEAPQASPAAPEGADAEFGVPAASPEAQRQPIVWTGRAREPEKAGAEATAVAVEPKAQQQQEAKLPPQRLKLNTAFLLNVVADAERGNQRRCAEDATAVSLSVLEKAIAAGVRPQLARSAEAGNAAVRRAVLSVAQQQRLAACTALLTEVALHYGFALHVAPDVGDEDAGVEDTAAQARAAETSSGAAAAAQQAPAEAVRRWAPLHVALDLTSRQPRPVADLQLDSGNEDVSLSGHPQRSPAVSKAPVLNATATRLAGAAFGDIGMPGLVPRPKPRKATKAAPQQLEAASDEDAAEMVDDWEEDAEGDDLLQEFDDEPEEATSSGAASDDAGPGLLNGRLGPSQGAAQPGGKEEAGGLTARLLRQDGALRGAPAAKRKLPAVEQPKAAAQNGPAASPAATAVASVPMRGLRMDAGQVPSAEPHDAREVEDEPAGHASNGRGGQDRKQASMQRLRSDDVDPATEPDAKRARLGAAHLPKPASNGRVGSAAAAAQKQGSTPQPGAAMARMLSRAAAAAVSVPAGSGGDGGPAANGRGADEGPAMRSSGLAGRLSNGHPQDSSLGESDGEERVGKAAAAGKAGRQGKRRAIGGLFGAAMASVEGRSGKPRAAAARRS